MKKTVAKKEPAAEPKAGDWMRALKPGQIGTPGGVYKLVIAGEKFQLPEGQPFTDTWMEPTDEPITAKPEDAKVVKERQEEESREHEKTDLIRRGKFSFRSVPPAADAEDEAGKTKTRTGAPVFSYSPKKPE